MICAHNRDDRTRILGPIKDWLMKQISVDPNASACYNSIQEVYHLNQNLACNGKSDKDNNKAFKEHYIWDMMSNHDSCISFQEIVKAKGVPAIKNGNAEPRKAIPKKIRGEAWKNQFGDSTTGSCYCCKKELDVFDDWHAGHIISHANNGADTPDNLRPVCGSCNLSMGTENMDDFKRRCYPTI
jgi:HNH endonuclease